MLSVVLTLALGLSSTAPASQTAPPTPAAVSTQDPTPPVEAPAGSDAPAEAKEPPTPPHTGLHALASGLVGDFKHLPAKDNAYLALIGGAVAAGAYQVDHSFNARLRSHYDAVNKTFAAAKYVGNTPEQVALSLGTYAYGRIFNAPKASHLGMDLLRAQLVTTALVQPIKFATHRERPDGSNAQSFPSGHAAVTFAGATVLERHLGWRKAIVAYAAATYVAASRLHDNRHYLSDVAFGAAVGTIAGRTVTQHGRNMWTVLPVNEPGGVGILAMRVGR
jgi:membrane-associated phospholipid phosphatase